MDGITDSIDMSLSKLLEIGKDREALVCCSPRGSKKSDMTEQLNQGRKGCVTLAEAVSLDDPSSHRVALFQL